MHGSRCVPAVQHDEIEARQKHQRNHSCAQHGQTSDPTTMKLRTIYLYRNYPQANLCARIF